MNINIITSIDLKNLPPAISLILALESMGHNVSVLVPYLEDNYKLLFEEHNICFYECSNESYINSIKNNIYKINKFLYKDFNKFIFSKLSMIDKENDLVWILHEETAMRLGKEILNYRYNITIYELRRKINVMKFFSSNVELITKNAVNVITPEYNRGQILAAWWGLTNSIHTIPNKPFEVETTVSTPEVSQTVNDLLEKLGNKKMVLYQGAFGEDRYLEPFIEACMNYKDLCVVLMGNENDYLNKLLTKYKNSIIYVPSIKAPYHLEVTKHAYIGIVTYKVANNIYDPLNVVFCAPNKIFEYSKFGVPMICSGQPGLKYTVEYFNAGKCIEELTIDNIEVALKNIVENYSQFSVNAEKFYNNTDIIELIEKCL